VVHGVAHLVQKDVFIEGEEFLERGFGVLTKMSWSRDLDHQQDKSIRL